MRLLVKLLVGACLAVQIAPSQGSQPILIPGKPSVSVEGFFFIPVKVNGAAFWCGLDSGGSAVFSMDEKKALSAGLKPDSTGTSSGVGAAVVRDQRLRGATLEIGAVTLRDQTIVMRPYPEEAPEMDCIMGLALLRGYVVEFDYTLPGVRLFDPQAFVPNPKAFTVPFRVDRNNPVSDVTIEMQDGSRFTAPMVLDTGAGYYSAVLGPSLAAQHDVVSHAARTARRPDRPRGTGGEVRILSTRPASLSLGGARVNQPVVGLLQSDSAGFPWEGLLGSGFFQRFTAAFDFRRQQLYLVPNANFDQRHPFDASGLGLRRETAGGVYWVEIVQPGTAAASAGLQEGDLLLMIDGTEARSLDPVEIRRRLSRPGEARELTIRRGAQDIHATLKLADRL